MRRKIHVYTTGTLPVPVSRPAPVESKDLLHEYFFLERENKALRKRVECAESTILRTDERDMLMRTISSLQEDLAQERISTSRWEADYNRQAEEIVRLRRTYIQRESVESARRSESGEHKALRRVLEKAMGRRLP